jgi:hypothetical protein
MDLVNGYSSGEDDAPTHQETRTTITPIPRPSILDRMMADARKNPLSSNQPAREDSAPQGNRAGNEDDSEQEDSDDASDDESGGAAGEAEPELADIERKRKLKRKAPTKTGAHRGGGTRLSREPKIRPQQRINEFPGEGWAVFNGKLFCQGCKEELSLIRSSCTHHVKTQKHISKRVAREKLLLRDANLKDDLTAYFTANAGEKGASVRPEVHVERYAITRGWAAAGVPLQKLDALRPVLERQGASLTDSSHMRQYVPKIESEELATTEAEIKEDRGSLTLDGTRRNGEAIAGVFRSCKRFNLLHRLVLFMTTAKNVKGVELAAITTNLFILKLRKDVESLTCISRDACSVNHAAAQSLKVTFINAEDIICICHTLSCTGDELNFPDLNEFMTPWLVLVQNQPSAKAEWKSIVGEGMKGYSNIRWHSKGEIIIEICKHFTSLPDFLAKLLELGIGDATTTKMISIYERNPLLLELSMAAHMDIELLISTTYEMEGERLEILLVYSRVECLRALGSRIKSRARGILLNVESAIARMQTSPGIGMVFTKNFDGYGEYEGRITGVEEIDGVKLFKVVYEDDDEEEIDNAEMKQLLKAYGDITYSGIVDSIVPAFDYLENRLTGNCRNQFSCEHTYEVFRLARVFDPSFASENEALINQAFIRSLASIKPLARDDGALIRALERDSHLYIAAARGFTVDHSNVDVFTEAVLAW